MSKILKPHQAVEKKPISITKTFVESAATPGYHQDEKLNYFYLKITESGSKIYQVYGKVRGERSPVRVTIGKHGEELPDGTTLTAEKARDKAQQIRGLMRDGKNPNQDRKATKREELERRAKAENLEKQRSITLRQVFSDYCTESDNLTKNSLDTYRYVVNACFEDWLNMPIASITWRMVKARHDEISIDFKAQANLAMKILRAICNFARVHYEDEGENPIFTSNPVSRWVEKTPKGKKPWNELKPRTELIEDHQMQAWFQAVGELKHEVARDFFVFLMLTGPRKAEAERLKWKDIDKKKGIITFVDTKNGESYQLPITEQIAVVLQSRSASSNGEYVFPGQSADGHISDMRNQIELIEERARELLVAQAGDKHERNKAQEFFFTHHSLRRTFTTVAARYLPSYMVAAMTNHKNKSDVTQTHYTHISAEDMREPLRKVNEHMVRHGKVDLRELLKLPKSKQTVVSIRRKA